MRNILSNAFSINMVASLINTMDPAGCSYYKNAEPGLELSIKEIPAEAIPNDCISIVGHADTATILTNMLGFEVTFNRVSFTAEHGDVLYVAQYNGPRLPEGATTLPEGAGFKFYRIEGIDIDYGYEPYPARCMPL